MFISLVHKSGYDEEPDQAFIVAFEAEDEIVRVCGYETLKEAQESWSSTYNRKHALGRLGSMSAWARFIMFQPKLHELRDMAELNELIENVDGMAEPVSLTCVAGRVMAFPGTDAAMKAWENGVSAELINEGVNDEMAKKDARTTFEKYGYKDFEDFIREALYPGDGTPIPSEELEKHFASLPPQIQGIARDWGTNDTVFRDQALIHPITTSSDPIRDPE